MNETDTATGGAENGGFKTHRQLRQRKIIVNWSIEVFAVNVLEP